MGCPAGAAGVAILAGVEAAAAGDDNMAARGGDDRSSADAAFVTSGARSCPVIAELDGKSRIAELVRGVVGPATVAGGGVAAVVGRVVSRPDIWRRSIHLDISVSMISRNTVTIRGGMGGASRISARRLGAVAGGAIIVVSHDSGAIVK